MIKFKHNGPHVSYQKTCPKRYDGANAPRWNSKVEPFISQWIVQKKDDMHMIQVVEDCMPSWHVTGKWRSYYRLVFKLQEGIGWP
jgi:hypothetical protein